MRPSLLPGLIAAARRNLDRGAASVRLFELGRRYLGDGEHPTLGAAARRRTARARAGRAGKAQPFDAFDAKAEVLALLEAAGAPVANLQVFPDAGPDLASRPLGQARPRPEDDRRQLRRASPAACKEPRRARGRCRRRDLSRRDPGAARPAGMRARAYAPPALQAVTRDFAFIVPAELAGRRTCSARSAARTRRRSPTSGCSTASRRADGLSLAFEVTLQPVEKSFTDEQIGEISKRIVAAAEKLGARLQELVRAR